MDVFSLAAGGLSSLPLLSDAETRSISAENPKGEKGGGAKEKPDGPGHAAAELGKGWKVRPYINLPANSKVEIADIEGPGVIQHIWLTVNEQAYQTAILRIFWDDEKTPSVEVPLGDFFCNGHGLKCQFISLPIAVNSSGGMNCYFPMPFRKRARIELDCQWRSQIDGFYYQINYAKTPVPDDAAYFHAQWRRSNTTRENPEHILLDGVKGKGHYVGTYLAWAQMSNGRWGEGEVKFFIDGDKEYPTICGTGTEDYFGGAWCFGDGQFAGPFLGYPMLHKKELHVPRHGLYRWHIPDPIRFKKDLKVTVQALGWYPDQKFQPLTDDIASVAYWYQSEPHGKYPAMLPLNQRWSR